MNSSASEPLTLDAFYRKHHSFVWGPAIVAGSIWAITNHAPVKAYFESHEMSPFGMSSSVHYVVYSIMMCYAVHGWACTHVTPDKQVRAPVARTRARAHSTDLH